MQIGAREVAFIHGLDSRTRTIWFWVPMHFKTKWRLAMNRLCCGSQTRGPDRASARRSGAWFQCMLASERGLHEPGADQPTPDPSQEGNWQTDLAPFPGGLGVGSWSRCTRQSERRLSMS